MSPNRKSRLAIQPSSRQAADAASAADTIEAVERRDALLKALGRLSARQREGLVLVFYHELTVEAAAEVMGTGVGSARTHYARGKEKLRMLLRDLA